MQDTPLTTVFNSMQDVHRHLVAAQGTWDGLAWSLNCMRPERSIQEGLGQWSNCTLGSQDIHLLVSSLYCQFSIGFMFLFGDFG